MNRQTGVPRESTRAGDKITRRFSTHEPSANGMYLFLRSLWFVRNAVALRCSPNNYITRARHERKETPKQEELGCSADSQNTISRLEERSRRSRARKRYTFPFSACKPVFHTQTNILPPQKQKLQDPPPIPQRARRPQIPRRSRPHPRLNRSRLVHRARLRARLRRRARQMGEPRPRRPRSRRRHRRLL
jgi:hypothetical protein